MADRPLSRREFLKVGFIGGLAAARAIKEFKPEQLSEIKIPLNLDYINLNSNHDLSLEIIKPSTALVIGETDLGTLNRYYGQYDEKLDYGVLDIPKSELEAKREDYHKNSKGIGSIYEDSMIHKITLAEMRKSGVDISATDNTASLSDEIRKSYKNEEEIVGVSSFLAKHLGIWAVDVQIAHKYSFDAKKTFALMLLTEIPIVHDYFKATTSGQNPNGIKLIDKLSGEIYEYLILTRNLNMVHNTKTVQTMLEQNKLLSETIGFDAQGTKEIMFFAGSSHVGVKELFKESQDDVSAKLEKNIDQDINLGLMMLEGKQFYDATNDRPELKDPEDLKQLWLGLLTCYTYPISSFYDREEHKSFDYQNLPNSPRAMLWSRLMERFNNEQDGHKKLLLYDLARLLKDKDITNFNEGARNLSPVKAMFDKMLDARRRGLTTSEQEIFEGVKLIYFEGVPFVVNSKDLTS